MKSAEQELATIPAPPGLPLLGNLFDIDSELPLGSLMHLASTYGPIYQLNILGSRRVMIGSRELLNELCDESRFSKIITASLEEVRNGVGSGLFTAYPDEHDWQIAHRVLMPAFGPLSIRGMFDEMHDIASQLVMKWARYGDSIIPVTEDFTRLTLDTIALCAMDYRFNSFYQEGLHPFVKAMSDFLAESGKRAQRMQIAQAFYRQERMQYENDIEVLRKTSDEVLTYRKKHPNERKDLLNAMINGKDTKTGEKLSDKCIMDNLITFLIAGHETTSGLLSFAFYYLLKNPSAYQRAQQEVDEIVGTGRIEVDHLSKVPYITAILRETLRLTPTAPAFAVQPLQDEIIGGKYRVLKGQPIVAVLPVVHRDPAVYGNDAEEWRPERMLDESFQKLPPNSWKPFGNGVRACIGRPFAWQEALLVIVILLQNFNFVMEDPQYQLQLKQTLTIKPKEFRMRAILRNKVSPTQLERSLASTTTSIPRTTSGVKPIQAVSVGSIVDPKGHPMSIYYGSNTGTCEALAHRIASDAGSRGFRVRVIDTLDAAYQNLPTEEPVVIISASYEGQPPDNAAHFFKWLEGLTGSEMAKVSYSEFGCGHSDWKATFHRIPNAIDELLEKRGGKRIAARGGADAAHGDIFTDFETWEDQIFWPAMVNEYEVAQPDSGAPPEANLEVQVSTTRSSNLRLGVKEARVVNAKTLTAAGEPLKKHMELALPSDMTYLAGDYLAILPLNPQENVQRAMRRFGLPWDAMLTISSKSPTTLPTDLPLPAIDIFGAYVELAQPATKRNVSALVEAAADEPTKTELKRLADPAFQEEISSRQVSMLDLLDRFPSVSLPLNVFISSLPPMRVRQYSISSSPLWNPSHVTLTYAVLNQPSMSGQGRFVGVASSYLSKLEAGDKLHVAVRPSNQAFHLPTDSENVPVIMIAAGTGLAPFRGFVQERAAQIGAGRSLAPAMLFIGCRSPETDELYRNEFDRWEKMGAVDIRRAYSKNPEKSRGCKYVQHRLWADRKHVVELWDRGGRVFVCGSQEVGQGVKETSLAMMREVMKASGEEISDERAGAWFDKIRNERYATDVFA